VTVGLVLAAGEGRRFGGPKQLARVDGRPLVEHALAAVAGLDPVIVVLGAHADEVRAGADLSGAEIVVCDDWAEGMGASLRAGLGAATGTGTAAARDAASATRAGADEVVVVLADQPFITRAAVERVRAAPGDGARATYGGAPGHPVVLRRALLARAGELRGDAGFRGVAMTEVECGDLADPRDIDTQADLEVVRR
jgi:CTP:molybdopterin cytidylyltransferase MocA